MCGRHSLRAISAILAVLTLATFQGCGSSEELPPSSIRCTVENAGCTCTKSDQGNHEACDRTTAAGMRSLCCSAEGICHCDIVGCYRDADSKNCICGPYAAAAASLVGIVEVASCPLAGGVTCCQRLDLGHCWCAIGLQCDKDSVETKACAPEQITCQPEVTDSVSDCRAAF